MLHRLRLAQPATCGGRRPVPAGQRSSTRDLCRERGLRAQRCAKQPSRLRRVSAATAEDARSARVVAARTSAFAAAYSLSAAANAAAASARCCSGDLRLGRRPAVAAVRSRLASSSSRLQLCCSAPASIASSARRAASTSGATRCKVRDGEAALGDRRAQPVGVAALTTLAALDLHARILEASCSRVPRRPGGVETLACQLRNGA